MLCLLQCNITFPGRRDLTKPVSNVQLSTRTLECQKQLNTLLFPLFPPLLPVNRYMPILREDRTWSLIKFTRGDTTTTMWPEQAVRLSNTIGKACRQIDEYVAFPLDKFRNSFFLIWIQTRIRKPATHSAKSSIKITRLRHIVLSVHRAFRAKSSLRLALWSRSTFQNFESSMWLA